MRMRLISGVSVLALALGVTSAYAEDQPPLVPTRDVAVTYQVRDQSGAERTVHMFFDARGQRVHIDLIGRPGFLVIDHKENRVIVVNSEAKNYIEMPAPPAVGNLVFRSPDLHFTRKGTEKVAGISCTLWQLAPGKGAGGDACITSDGVVLQGHPASSPPNTGITAISVTYGQQPSSLFAPPPGYQRVQPQMPGAPEGSQPAPAAPPSTPAP